MTIQLETHGNAPAAVLDREWNEPDGIGPRGTLILLVGRGENGDVYNRFGSRIAADAYRVRTVAVAASDPAAARARVAELLADDELPSPRVLVGSDSGAALALELAAEGAAVAAVIVAGLPTGQPGESPQPAAPGEWGDELDARTACPNHQGVLGRSAEAGAIWQPLPASLLEVVASGITVPVLAVHGSADRISPLPAARAVYESIPRHEIAVVAGGRHDILNDVTHRSVAATVILFLERLRLDPSLAPIVETL
jgi:pimeloyl-ACP methyl ester carboxylesterase